MDVVVIVVFPLVMMMEYAVVFAKFLAPYYVTDGNLDINFSIVSGNCNTIISQETSDNDESCFNEFIYAFKYNSFNSS